MSQNDEVGRDLGSALPSPFACSPM